MSRDGSDDLERAVDDLADRLPERLWPLARLAYNYRWSWMPGGEELFGTLDPLRELAANPSGCSRPRRRGDRARPRRPSPAAARWRRGWSRPGPADAGPVTPERPIAFFCAEFGIHRSLPLYGGGLGVLAGDMLKAASDLARAHGRASGSSTAQGYFHQRLDDRGWQHEYWIDDRLRAPARRAASPRPDGEPLTVDVADPRARRARPDLADRRRPRAALPARHGPPRQPPDRPLDHRPALHRRSAHAARAVRACSASGACARSPRSASSRRSCTSTRATPRWRRSSGCGAQSAPGASPRRRRSPPRASATVFTTHTPVAAGNESVSLDEVERSSDGSRERARPAGAAFGSDACHLERRRAGRRRITPLGAAHEPRVERRQPPARRGRARDVAARSGRVDAVDEVPIGHVTNGVHMPTWMAGPMQELLDRHLGPGWRQRGSTIRATWEARRRASRRGALGRAADAARELVEYVRERVDPRPPGARARRPTTSRPPRASSTPTS